jgi:chromosome segregation ATPase
LIWFFRKSRDGWKHKYLDLKSSEKANKNRIADLTKSREQWRKKAEQADEQRAALKAEIAVLQSQIAAADKKKRISAVAH